MQLFALLSPKELGQLIIDPRSTMAQVLRANLQTIMSDSATTTAFAVAAARTHTFLSRAGQTTPQPASIGIRNNDGNLSLPLPLRRPPWKTRGVGSASSTTMRGALNQGGRRWRRKTRRTGSETRGSPVLRFWSPIGGPCIGERFRHSRGR